MHVCFLNIGGGEFFVILILVLLLFGGKGIFYVYKGLSRKGEEYE